jgi:hypothetical protein
LVAILDSKWSPYVLLPVNIHFHWNLHFWNFNDFFNFYIGGHFEMVAILKIPKLECTSWDGDPPSCEV